MCEATQHEATSGIPHANPPLSALEGHFKINQFVLPTNAKSGVQKPPSENYFTGLNFELSRAFKIQTRH
jgi:hypothetical protein